MSLLSIVVSVYNEEVIEIFNSEIIKILMRSCNMSRKPQVPR